MGIIDSLYEPQGNLAEKLDVGFCKDYIGESTPDTTHHGSSVVNLISGIAVNATYDFLRVVNQDGVFNFSNCLEALDRASRIGASIINLSLGSYEANCQGNCRLCFAVNKLAERGITVVVSAGNKNKEGQEVFCPAKAENSISVSGLVAHCQPDLDDNTSELGPGLDYRPPGSFWTDTSDLEEADKYQGRGTYCGGRGCTVSHDCDENRVIKPWEYNVESFRDKPDVLAPIQSPAYEGDLVYIGGGTSFAAPLVTGTLASLISELTMNGKNPTPSTLRKFVRSTSNPIEGSSIGCFDAKETVSQVCDHYGLEMQAPNPNEGFPHF